MEQNAYKNELNQVVYTEAGRAALTEALLEARPAPRRRSWTRKGFAALLAAVLLVQRGSSRRACLEPFLWRFGRGSAGGH